MAFLFVFVSVELVLYTFLFMHDDGRESRIGSILCKV
jgi:hypothetical protein